MLSQEIDNEPALEIGYRLFPKFWHQGYASEAALFFKTLGFENNYADKLVSIIDVGNSASQKVAMRNGMVKIKTTSYCELEVDIYSINKSDWIIHP